MIQRANMDQRGSGILLHITSLPSSYGVGDLGPEAYRFVDFLGQTRQSCWRVLPLNPTDPVYGISPYSSISAFAGNTLFISPDRLLDEGLLSREDLEPVPSFSEARGFFTQLTGLFKNLNYAPRNSPEYAAYPAQIDNLVKTLGRPPAATPEAQEKRKP